MLLAEIWESSEKEKRAGYQLANVQTQNRRLLGDNFRPDSLISCKQNICEL